MAPRLTESQQSRRPASPVQLMRHLPPSAVPSSTPSPSAASARRRSSLHQPSASPSRVAPAPMRLPSSAFLLKLRLRLKPLRRPLLSHPSGRFSAPADCPPSFPLSAHSFLSRRFPHLPREPSLHWRSSLATHLLPRHTFLRSSAHSRSALQGRCEFPQYAVHPHPEGTGRSRELSCVPPAPFPTI